MGLEVQGCRAYRGHAGGVGLNLCIGVAYLLQSPRSRRVLACGLGFRVFRAFRV